MKTITRLLLSLLLILITSCSTNVADIPYIGWRIDVARQRAHYRRKEIERQEELERQCELNPKECASEDLIELRYLMQEVESPQ